MGTHLKRSPLGTKTCLSPILALAVVVQSPIRNPKSAIARRFRRACPRFSRLPLSLTFRLRRIFDVVNAVVVVVVVKSQIGNRKSNAEGACEAAIAALAASPVSPLRTAVRIPRPRLTLTIESRIL